MLLYAFLLILFLRPSYALLGWFALAFSVLFVGLRLLPLDFNDPLVWGQVGAIFGSLVVNLAIFCLIGGVIMTIRGDKSKQRTDRKLDKEMEKIRAEIAARENGQPPTQS